jgi:hypothetical protein
MERIYRVPCLVALGLLASCTGWLTREEPEDPRLLEWRSEASALRGLDFSRRVPLFFITRDDLPELVRIELADVIESGYATDYRDAAAAFGLIPRELDLVDLLIRLNQDQIAGLYSVKRRAMYVLGGAAALPNRPIVIHELVHALQHQHFPRTLELMQALRHNDDVVLALGAAAEGDAMRVMALYESHEKEWVPDELSRAMRSGFRRDLEAPSGMLAEVPRIVRASLIFPYAAGFELAERAYRAEGRAGIDRMLRDAPLSAQRVRRADAQHDVEFLRLPAALAAQRAGEGCSAGHDNVAGVVGIESLFADHGAAQAGSALEASWSGDRYLHLRCPAGDELLWVTRWTSPQAAADFAVAYGRVAASIARGGRLAGVPRARAHGRTALAATPDLFLAAAELEAALEIRAYPGLTDWVRDACFPESPCPAPRSRAD